MLSENGLHICYPLVGQSMTSNHIPVFPNLLGELTTPVKGVVAEGEAGRWTALDWNERSFRALNHSLHARLRKIGCTKQFPPVANLSTLIE